MMSVRILGSMVVGNATMVEVSIYFGTNYNYFFHLTSAKTCNVKY